MSRSCCCAVAFAIVFAASASADVFRVLDDPREAAQARVDLIQQATTEIDALYFLARNDRITLGALALLRDARRRGVPTVRLIVDANFQHIPKAVLAHLRDEGVEIRVYHPMTLRHPSWLFRRMHEKLVLADGRRYIAGGRNLAEAYFGMAKHNFVDRDVYVEGASAADADRHFEHLWASAHVADLRVRVTRDAKRRASQLLTSALDALECARFVRLNTNEDWSHGEKERGAVSFLHDPVPDTEGTRVAVKLAELIGRAERSIVIESPYLVPSKSMLELLEKKAASGVYVLIVTNSLSSTDGVLPYAGYFRYRRRVARAGINVAEYKGPDTLHAKTMIIDVRVVVVGSYNVDPRSENLNTEVMCVVDDAQVASELRDAIDVHLQRSWRVERDGRLTMSGEDSPPSRSRWFGALALRLLVPFIEGQL